ncbi:hypothetical protein LX36DRAFT_328359 [Colletotrichum falcatum]|nr:hypothetical protein LX36DRAFT_328359 [Colletotrichum falcatum]
MCSSYDGRRAVVGLGRAGDLSLQAKALAPQGHRYGGLSTDNNTLATMYPIILTPYMYSGRGRRAGGRPCTWFLSCPFPEQGTGPTGAVLIDSGIHPPRVHDHRVFPHAFRGTAIRTNGPDGTASQPTSRRMVNQPGWMDGWMAGGLTGPVASKKRYYEISFPCH